MGKVLSAFLIGLATITVPPTPTPNSLPPMPHVVHVPLTNSPNGREAYCLYEWKCNYMGDCFWQFLTCVN